MTFPVSKKAVLIGYPTLDYVVSTATPLRGHGTMAARIHSGGDWPRPGGAALYAATCLAAAGHAARPLAHVGDDHAGDIFVAACHAAGVEVDGIERRTGAKTPCCVLIHHDSGGYSCLLDMGGRLPDDLTPGQMVRLAEADLVVIGAGAAQATDAALKAVQPHQLVAWIAKDDPACFPPALCERLSRRADIVFHNRAERALVTPGAAIRIETLGHEGAVVHTGNGATAIPIEPLSVMDATGAGDTLAGGFLAHWLSGDRDPVAATIAGMAAARALLAARNV